MNQSLDCTDARLQLSARLDGELAADADLSAHLAACAECRAHAGALAGLAEGFAALRAPEPLPDLWPAIEARLDARPRRTRPRMLLQRAAAALIGFAGIGAAALVAERERDVGGANHRLLEHLSASHASPHALFAELPEYRLLRLAPGAEETR